MAQLAPASRSHKRDEILDVAEKLFAARGYGGVGLAEVAERAGLSKSSLFHHFPSKAQIYTAVMARILTDLESALIRALAEGGTPTQRLDHWVDTLIDLMAKRRTYPRLLLRVLVEDAELPAGLADGKTANDTIQRIGTTALRVLREGMQTGEFRRASAPHVLQIVIASTVHPLATGRFGDALLGRSMFDPAEVARRKREVKALLHQGLTKEGKR